MGRLDKGFIFCFIVSVWCGFIIGVYVGSRTTKYRIEKEAVKKKAGIVNEQGVFEWRVLTEDE